MDLQKTIKRIIAGDQSAFQSLVEAFQQYAFGLAFRILCDEEEARDSVQEAFIKVWKKLDSYQLEMKFQNWLSKIVVNTAIDRLRVIKRNNEVSVNNLLPSTKGLMDSSFQLEMENMEISSWIQLCADGLPEKQRMVFILRDIQGMDSEEVQLMLDLDDNSIKSNLYHARKAVRRKLSHIMDFEKK